MGVKTFTELDAWKLATELKLGVYRLTRTGPAATHQSYCDQITRSAASAPANIAEGFGRYQPKEFSQFLRVANGSLMETANHLRDGVDRGLLTPTEIEPLLDLARRSSAAVTSLIRYLRTAKPPHTQK